MEIFKSKPIFVENRSKSKPIFVENRSKSKPIFVKNWSKSKPILGKNRSKSKPTLGENRSKSKPTMWKVGLNPNQQWLGYRLKYRQNIDKKGHKKRRIAFSWEVLCGDRLCWVYSMLKEHDGSIDFKVKGSVLILVLMEHAQRVDLQKRSTIVYFTS